MHFEDAQTGPVHAPKTANINETRSSANADGTVRAHRELI